MNAIVIRVDGLLGAADNDAVVVVESVVVVDDSVIVDGSTIVVLLTTPGHELVPFSVT